MPEDKNQLQNSSTATAQKPRIDTSVLDEESKTYQSAAVNLANPDQATGDKNVIATEAQNTGTITTETPVATEADVTSKQEAQLPPPLPPSQGADLPPERPAKSHKTILIALIVILLLAVIGALTWQYLSSRNEPVNEPVVNEPVTVTEPIAEPAPEPPVVTIDTLSTKDTTPLITGTVDDTNAEVTVTAAGVDYLAVVKTDGSWSAQVESALSPGTYDISVSAVNDTLAGQDSSIDELTIQKPAPAPAPTPAPKPEPKPETTPNTGPVDKLPNTGPS